VLSDVHLHRLGVRLAHIPEEADDGFQDEGDWLGVLLLEELIDLLEVVCRDLALGRVDSLDHLLELGILLLEHLALGPDLLVKGLVLVAKLLDPLLVLLALGHRALVLVPVVHHRAVQVKDKLLNQLPSLGHLVDLKQCEAMECIPGLAALPCTSGPCS